MKLEEQCVSLDLAKRLKELGCKQDSYFCWAQPSSGDKIKEWVGGGDEFRLFATGGFLINANAISAFTVAELGEMLPMGYLSGKSENIENCWVCGKSTGDGQWFREDAEADSRAKMLCYLLENNLILPEAKI